MEELLVLIILKVMLVYIGALIRILVIVEQLLFRTDFILTGRNVSGGLVVVAYTVKKMISVQCKNTWYLRFRSGICTRTISITITR